MEELFPDVDLAVKDARRVSGIPGTINVKKEDVGKGMVNRMRDEFDGTKRSENVDFLEELKKVKINDIESDIMSELDEAKVELKLKPKSVEMSPELLKKMKPRTLKLWSGKLNSDFKSGSEADWELIKLLDKDGFDPESQIPYLVLVSQIKRSSKRDINRIMGDIKRYFDSKNTKKDTSNKVNIVDIIEGFFDDNMMFYDKLLREKFILNNGVFKIFDDNIGPILSTWIYDNYRTTTKNKRDIIDILTLRTESNKKETYLRYADLGNVVYYNLNDEKQIMIDGDGWYIGDKDYDKVIFRMSDLTIEQLEPMRGKKNLYELLESIPINRYERIMIMGTLVNALLDHHHPIINISGSQGTGKSAITLFFKNIIDPILGDPGSDFEKREDMALALSNHSFAAFDNISHLPDTISDVLARAATGGGVEKRILYKTKQMTYIPFKPTIIVNGISDVFKRSDLLDRTIKINTNKIKVKRGNGWWNSNEFRQEVFGAVLDMVSYFLKNRNKLNDIKSPIRLSDYYKVTVCICEKAGISIEDVNAAFVKNKELNADQALFSSILGSHIYDEVVSKDSFMDNAKNIMRELKNEGNCPYKSPKGIRDEWNRIKPSLEEIGFIVDDSKKDVKNNRLYIVKKMFDEGKDTQMTLSHPS